MELKDAADYICQRRVPEKNREHLAQKMVDLYLSGQTDKLHGLINSLMR